MNQEILSEYAHVRAEIKDLEERKEILGKEIVENLKTLGDAKLSSAYGLFTLAKKTTYEYSDAIKKRELELKEAKAVEVEAGAAKPKETQFLVYTAQ